MYLAWRTCFSYHWLLSAAISAVIAVLYGTASALSPAWLDRLLMRLVDVLLSVPSLLLVLFVQAVFGKNIIGMSAAIGLCGWFSMAKIVRTQAKTVKESGFVTASQCMGGGFFMCFTGILLQIFFHPFYL